MIKNLPNSQFCNLDLDRKKRIGFSEVIYCPGKTDEQLTFIAKKLFANHDNVIASRINQQQAKLLLKINKNVVYNQIANTAYLWQNKTILGRGTITVVSAGTCDLPVAEEIAIIAEIMGNKVKRINDAGICGLHRIMNVQKQLEKSEVVVAVAGMEGALPSVIGGLISRPIIAVPTSIGYGTSYQGLSALLSMLNSCAPGITVVNIDNGFGAAFAASRINRKHKTENS